MMLHQTDLGNARIEELLARAERPQRRKEMHSRGSPVGGLRILVARLLVRTGVRLHGEEPAVIGRVVILDQCEQAPQQLRPAA
jgi:hypothetical protein